MHGHDTPNISTVQREKGSFFFQKPIQNSKKHSLKPIKSGIIWEEWVKKVADYFKAFLQALILAFTLSFFNCYFSATALNLS